MSGWPKPVQVIHTLCAMRRKILSLLEDSTFKMMATDTMEHRTTFLTKWLQCHVIFNSSICMVLCHLGYMVPWTYIVSRETPRTSLIKLSTPHNNLWRIHPVAGYIPYDIWRYLCHLQHYPSLHHSASWAYTHAYELVVHKLGLCSDFLIFVFQQSVVQTDTFAIVPCDS